MFNHVKDQYITISTLLILGSWLLSSWEIHKQFNNESSLTLKYLRDKILLNNYHSERSWDGRKEDRTARLHGQGESSGVKNIIPEKIWNILGLAPICIFVRVMGIYYIPKSR